MALDCMQAVSEKLVKERLPSAIAMVENLIAIELSYINTNHAQFEGGSGAMIKMLTRLSEEMANESAVQVIYWPTVMAAFILQILLHRCANYHVVVGLY